MQHTGHVLLNCVCYWEGFWSAVGYLLVLRFLSVKCYTQIFNCMGVRAPNPPLFKGQLHCHEYGLFPKSDCYHEEFGLCAIPFPLDLYLLLLETLTEVIAKNKDFPHFALHFAGLLCCSILKASIAEHCTQQTMLGATVRRRHSPLTSAARSGSSASQVCSFDLNSFPDHSFAVSGIFPDIGPSS